MKGAIVVKASEGAAREIRVGDLVECGGYTRKVIAVGIFPYSNEPAAWCVGGPSGAGSGGWTAIAMKDLTLAAPAAAPSPAYDDDVAEGEARVCGQYVDPIDDNPAPNPPSVAADGVTVEEMRHAIDIAIGDADRLHWDADLFVRHLRCLEAAESTLQRVPEMEREIARLRERLQRPYYWQEQERAAEQADNARLRACLSEYADRTNWKWQGGYAKWFWVRGNPVKIAADALAATTGSEGDA